MKNHIRKSLTCVCLISQLGLSACAPSSDKVQATYVSPLQYQDYSCKQIKQEMMVVARHVNEVSGTEDHRANTDTAAVAGAIILWPTLFFLASKDQSTELAGLKGQYDALEEEAIQKNCSVSKEIEAAKKMEEKRKAAEKEEDSKANQNNTNH